MADNLNSAEFILHSIMTTYFTGFALGYQYILFTLVIPIVVITDDKNYLRFNSFRTVISTGLYVVMSVLLHYGIMQPKYVFSGTVSIISTSLLMYDGVSAFKQSDHREFP